jgi:hypothetical protein
MKGLTLAETKAKLHSDNFSDISVLESSDTELVDSNLPLTGVWKSLQCREL